MINKQIESAALQVDIEKFLMSGGAIKELKGFEPKPKPERVIVAPKYVSKITQNALIHWANSRSSQLPTRRTMLSEITGISLQRIRNSLTSNDRSRLTISECAAIKQAMPVVEKMELAA